jgi:hypothetical protein
VLPKPCRFGVEMGEENRRRLVKRGAIPLVSGEKSKREV